MKPSRTAIIGAGPAGLMAAEVLAGGGAQVTVYDRMPSAGRKFLMAGRGGLNLTHSEELTSFLARYGAAEGALRGAIESFPPDALRAWSGELGQSTFVGSSGRVFPRRHEGLAAVARVAAASRCGRRAIRVPASLDRMGRAEAPDVSDAGRRNRDRGGRDRPGARRRKLAAARLRMADGPRDS